MVDKFFTDVIANRRLVFGSEGAEPGGVEVLVATRTARLSRSSLSTTRPPAGQPCLPDAPHSLVKQAETP